MRKWVVTSAALFAVVGAAYAADVKSGLQTDDPVAAFTVNDVTGPNKGKSLCYRCQYGARPVVSIFTRKIDDNVTPSNAAYTMNSVSAVVYCKRLMRKLMKNTSPSVPSSSTIVRGPLKTAWPNGVSPVILPAASGATAAL